jgi:hypothetical protein
MGGGARKAFCLLALQAKNKIIIILTLGCGFVQHTPRTQTCRQRERERERERQTVRETDRQTDRNIISWFACI